MTILIRAGQLVNFVAFFISGSLVWADTPIDKSGYLTDERGNFVRNSYGECWRTGFWTQELAVAECDPDLVKVKEEPKELQPPPAIAPPISPSTAPSAAPFTEPSPASTAPSTATPSTAAPSTAAPSTAPYIAPAAAPALAPAKPPASQEKSVMAVSLRAETLFDFDEAKLKPDAEKELDEKIINGIKTPSGTKALLVTGHTDFIGTEKYNQELSERRANAVKEYLIRNGIAEQHIKVKGKGESERNPEANTRQACKGMKGKKLIACLQPDRRVTVVPEN